jgi:glycerol-3-phosphate dehydrogenase
VRYYDGFTNDARLTIDTLRSAAKSGAIILNYCRFENAARQDLWECELKDASSGRGFQVQARAVVNATGPWADGLPHSAVKLRLTKGVHVIVERSRLPVTETAVMTEEKRILFAIPWGERTILGTTDTDYNGSLEHICAEPADVEYILNVTNHFFPQVKITKTEVISSWAGVRPLIADPGGKPSEISRSHQIRMAEPSWWDVAGGKLTTYRLMAEQTVDLIVNGTRKGPKKWKPCRTAQEQLLPEKDMEGLSAILPPAVSRRAVEHYCRNEWALHLEDVMLRRTSWHYYYRNAQEIAGRVAEWMGELLEWSPEEHGAEMRSYQAAAGVRHEKDLNEPVGTFAPGTG